MSTSNTQVLFSTTGAVLERLRMVGEDFLLKYRILIFDEAHERSVESDILMLFVRQLYSKCSSLKEREFRIVLMSATADYKRYRQFFEHEGLSVKDFAISLPPSHHVESFFLDHLPDFITEKTSNRPKLEKKVKEFKETNEKMIKLMKQHIEIPNPSIPLEPPRPRLFSYPFWKYICQFIDLIHRADPNRRNWILVFLPTFRTISILMDQLRKHVAANQWSGQVQLVTIHGMIDFREDLKLIEAEKSKRCFFFFFFLFFFFFCFFVFFLFFFLFFFFFLLILFVFFFFFLFFLGLRRGRILFSLLFSSLLFFSLLFSSFLLFFPSLLSNFLTPFCRNIILATNIAETSLTISGLKYVIDPCLYIQVPFLSHFFIKIFHFILNKQ